jgi:hypothetical protein
MVGVPCGAGDVDVDLHVGVFFVAFSLLGFLVDGVDGAQELAREVAEHGGAARGDFILREEQQETGEEVVEGFRGF